MATILIIEDEPRVRATLRKILEHGQHTVIEAEDGEAGMHAFSAEHVDLVISDLLMPRQRGSAVISQIRALDPDIPIIAVSGSDDTDGPLDEAMNLGASMRMGKPYQVEDLLAAVSLLLGEG